MDLFDSSAQFIAELKASGSKVICYFSAGSYENWRADASKFTESDLGKPLDGWPGERWVDIRSQGVRQIVRDRLDLAKQKGCRAVEADNVDGYANDTGFLLTAVQQLEFNRFLAAEAHLRGLSIGLKNDLDQIVQLEPSFDFAVNEQCFEFAECYLLQPFIDNNKAVLNAEYRQQLVHDSVSREALCRQASGLHFSTLVLPLELDGSFRYSC